MESVDLLRWERWHSVLSEVFEKGMAVEGVEDIHESFRSYVEGNPEDMADLILLTRVAMALMVYEFRKESPEVSAGEILEAIAGDVPEVPFPRVMLRGVVETAMGDREVAEAIPASFHFVGGALLVPRLARVNELDIGTVVNMSVAAAKRRDMRKADLAANI